MHGVLFHYNAISKFGADVENVRTVAMPACNLNTDSDACI